LDYLAIHADVLDLNPDGLLVRPRHNVFQTLQPPAEACHEFLGKIRIFDLLVFRTRAMNVSRADSTARKEMK
jgi:hypothetical protein